MANQTVTQSVNLDSPALLGLANGESITILTGSTLYINSEPMWSTQSAYLGNIFINDGTCIIDGTKIKEINYTSSTVLPAIHNYVSGTISNGGGEIVKVVGSTTSGTIKIREMFGTEIQPNEPFLIYNSSTSSVLSTATASSAGTRTSHMRIYGFESRHINIARLGTLIVTGAWLDIGISSGTANQIMTIPSGIDTPIPSLWVETASGSNQFEVWNNAGTQRWGDTTGVAGDIDRGKFFSQSAAIGSAGTYLRWNLSPVIGFGNGTTCGAIPPSASRVRMPNVLLESTAGTNTRINTTIGTRWEMSVTSSGQVNMNTVLCPGLYLNMAQPYSVRLENVAGFNQIAISEAPEARLINCGVGIFNSQSTNPCLNITSNQYTLVDKGHYSINVTTNNSWTHQFNTSNNIEIISGTIFDAYAKAGAAHYALYLNTCNNVTMSYPRVYGAGSQFAISTNVLVTSYSNADIISGTVSTANTQNAVLINQGCNNITFVGFTGSGVLARLELVQVLNSSNIKFIDFGSWNNELNLGLQSTAILNSAGSNNSVEMSRCYTTQQRSAVVGTFTNSNNKFLIQNCKFAGGVSYNTINLNSRSRGLRFGSGTLGTAIQNNSVAVYGTHFYDFFISNVSGAVGVIPHERTAETPSSASYVITTGSGLFNSTNGLALRNVNDEIEWTWPWYVLGHTAFANQATQSTGTGVNRLLFTYAIDTGSGQYSAFKSASIANLLTETLDPTTGFKLKLRAKCITPDPANLLTGYLIPTVTTAAAQSGSLYPLTEINTSLVLTGLVSGSEIRVYRTSTGTEIAGNEDATGSFTYNYTWAGADDVVDIVIHAVQYEHIRYSDIPLTSTGVTIPIQQRFDRNYSNS